VFGSDDGSNSGREWCLIGNGVRCLLALWKQLVVLLLQWQKVKDENGVVPRC
jgi:hypothetical protein